MALVTAHGPRSYGDAPLGPNRWPKTCSLSTARCSVVQRWVAPGPAGVGAAASESARGAEMVPFL
jgi:hypothetical protein